MIRRSLSLLILTFLMISLLAIPMTSCAGQGVETSTTGAPQFLEEGKVYYFIAPGGPDLTFNKPILKGTIKTIEIADKGWVKVEVIDVRTLSKGEIVWLNVNSMVILREES